MHKTSPALPQEAGEPRLKEKPRATARLPGTRCAALTQAPDPAQAARQHLLWAMILHRRGQKEAIASEVRDLEQAIPWSAGPCWITMRCSRSAALLLPEEARMLALAK